MSIERAVYQLLKDVPIPGDRIYALRAPQNSPAPFVVYQRTGGNRDRHMRGVSGLVEASFQIDVYHEQYHPCRLLANNIEQAIDGVNNVTVSYGGNSPQDTIKIASISCENDTDLLDQTDEPFLYRVSSDYLIMYHQE